MWLKIHIASLNTEHPSFISNELVAQNVFNCLILKQKKIKKRFTTRENDGMIFKMVYVPIQYFPGSPAGVFGH